MSGSPVSGSSYERLLLIGRGGMGEVFLARQRGVEGFQRPVALKRILPGHGNDPDHRRMFLSEARIMASLNHPNICQTVDFCSADSDLFLVLELLDGVNLAHLMKEVGAIPTPVVGGILLQALAGLAHAHSKGLIHRDLSPSNLFLTSDGVLKILDFGVAKVMGSELSSSGLKGKSPYMSPEQVAGRAVDERSDLFALGAVGLEALSGTALFLRDSEYLTYQAILEGTRPVGLTTSPLDPVLARCLEMEPPARPQSARQLAQAIRTALVAHGGEASPHDLAGYVEEHMADVLERYRALMADALKSGAGEPGPILHTVEMQAVQPMALATTMASPGFTVSPPTDLVRRPASRWRGLAALLGLLAIGLGSALWLNMRASGEPSAAIVPVDAAPVARLPVDAAPPIARAVTVDAAPPAADAAPTSAVPAPRPRKLGQGLVSLDSSPFATIEIDGKEVGTTPLLRHSLPEGIHRVVATAADGRQQRFKIRVRAGKLTARRLTFD